MCERDTFQGERCLYNALNDKIRHLLLKYDYSKSTDPLQPFAAHMTSLLAREHPQTSDIVVAGAGDSFKLHKLILSARSPYFSQKLQATPAATSWKLPHTLPPQSFSIAISYLYFGELPNDVGGGPGTGFSEEEVLNGIDKIAKHLEIRTLFEDIIEGQDRKYARQRRTVEVEKGRDQLESWFNKNVLRHRVATTVAHADNVRWDRENDIFADVLLRADESEDHDETSRSTATPPVTQSNGIAIGPLSQPTLTSSTQPPRRSVLFPAHKAMLLRSEYFLTMFSSSFREAQERDYLQIINIDCEPEVLEIVLKFLYTEKTDMPLDLALDVLYAADLLLIEKLKTRAAVTISTLGSGSLSQIPTRLDTSDNKKQNGLPPQDVQSELDIYEVVRAGWLLRVPRLEEFGARYMAFGLESFIDTPEFEEIVKESADRIRARQETDTIELLDDIRYYLSERFRLRFADAGIEDMMEEEEDDQDTLPDTTRRSFAESEPKVNGTSQVTNLPAGNEAETPANEVRVPAQTGKVRTLDGEEVEDDLEGEAMNYQILLGKIDLLLEKLKLDA